MIYSLLWALWTLWLTEGFNGIGNAIEADISVCCCHFWRCVSARNALPMPRRIGSRAMRQRERMAFFEFLGDLGGKLRKILD